MKAIRLLIFNVIILVLAIPVFEIMNKPISDREFMMTGLEIIGISNSKVRLTSYFAYQRMGLGQMLGLYKQEDTGGHSIHIFDGGFIDNFKQDVLAHELIHLKQTFDGRLIDHDSLEYVVYYDNIRYDLRFTPYSYRPWENEAFAGSKKFRDEIKAKVYKKRLEGIWESVKGGLGVPEAIDFFK